MTAMDFLTHLSSRHRISEVAVERVRRVQTETSERLAPILLKLGLLSEADLTSEMAAHSGYPCVDADATLQRADITELAVTDAFLRAHQLVPIAKDESGLTIACWDVLDEYPVKALAFACEVPIRWMIATQSQIERALQVGVPRSEDSRSEAPNAFEDEEIERLKDLASEAPVIRLVQRLIGDAVRQRASDIHLEAAETALHIRFRLDGLLQEVESHPKEISASVISRLKIMAGINIAERRLPQDGRIRVTVRGKEIDFRVATTPTLHGESMVLRILDRQDVALDFEALGFDATLQAMLREAIGRPHGIVLVTGPTGSGKTTTLYAALKEINTPEKKILTVEDPVEYMLAGVNQVPIRPQIGLSFANALRSFLRQDPDVMMVGEIRDRETADIAIQAALTGHLLLSTLHTNTAAAAITRLLDMGMDDYLLTSTLHLIVGQRLVRKLCAHCRQPYPPGADTRHKFAVADEAINWYRPVGCAQCQGGYKGRTTIIEALPMSDAVRAAVLARADAHQVEQVAIGEGMRTLFRHGLDRVNQGMTTLEEVLRVTSFS